MVLNRIEILATRLIDIQPTGSYFSQRTMHESTIPFGQVELMHVSSYVRYLDELDGSPGMRHDVVLGTRLSDLSPSLQADLLRDYDKRSPNDRLDVLEVMAASVRHCSAVTIHCTYGNKAMPISVFPQRQCIHCPLPLSALGNDALRAMSVLHVEPTLLTPPGQSQLAGQQASDLYSPLAPWLWEFAWHGARCELLPAIAGPAAYRIAPTMAWSRWPMDHDLLSAVQRLLNNSVNMRELSDLPGMSRERAARLLNALYLQAGLIVTRSTREAFSESFWGGLSR